MGETPKSRQSTASPRNVLRERAPLSVSVASTILQQLGGGRFTAMTGARNMTAMRDGLQFDIGRNGSQANRVRVILDGDDTYRMQFWKKGRDVNEYAILMRYADKGYSEAEFNAKVRAETERARRNSQPKMLKEYTGLFFDQLQPFFTEYTKLRTRL